MTLAPPSQRTDSTELTVRCERAYARLLSAKYQAELFICWQGGFMTICRIRRTADLTAVCAE